MAKVIAVLLLAGLAVSAQGRPGTRELLQDEATTTTTQTFNVAADGSLVPVAPEEALTKPPRKITTPPGALECGGGLGEISIEEITPLLFPCVFGVVPTCCDNLAPLFKIGEKKNSPLEGCLCNELILTATVKEVEKVQATELVGFDGTRFMTVLQGCGINFFFGEGDATCPNIIPASLVGDTGGDDDDDDQIIVRRRRRPPGLLGLLVG